MNPVVHFEIPYEDPERISLFYQSVFGWRMQVLGEDMGNYILATTADADVREGASAGAIDGGFYPKKLDWPSQHPSIVIAVENIEESMSNVQEAGGKVLGEPMAIPGIGLYVSFLDPEGNRSSILQPTPGSEN
jgi:hypothetical protein